MIFFIVSLSADMMSNWLCTVFCFGYISYLLSLSSCLQTDGECRTLKFKSVIQNRVLTGHVLKSYVVASKDDCELKCYLEADCMSINLELEANGKYLCELSGSDHDMHPKDLEVRYGFIYGPTKNSCVNNECSSNGRCQTGFTDRGYRCVCSAGSTGEYCEKGLGLAKSNPGLSCEHVLKSGSSIGDGEYWIDIENDGDPIKVFCDMTTDGGGWLLIVNVARDSPGIPTDLNLESSYDHISSYANNKMAINPIALNKLRAYWPFTQLRFHCNKRLVGRTFHVTTANNSAGEAAVQYFCQNPGQPRACGSFVRMQDDNSQLASLCHKWGGNAVWGHSLRVGGYGLLNDVAYVNNKHHWKVFEKKPNKPRINKRRCDDSTNADVSTGDFWRVYVR